uniref:Kinesin light chain n=1 Tax=Cercocebus atys TaxID=9531 RepID=A0A2K5NV30_CERAT
MISQTPHHCTPEKKMSVQVAAPGSAGLKKKRLSPEELVRQTRQKKKGLEALRAEHRGLEKKMAEALVGQGPATGKKKLEEKQQVVSHSLEAIELGLGEAQVQKKMSAHVGALEAEKQKKKSQARRLAQENVWLREELEETQRRLRASEEKKTQLEEEKRHLEFLKKKRQYDPPTETQQSESPPRRKKKASLFPSPEAKKKAAAQQGGYEIPARKKNLHNLVIQYAGQGRYEVAVPLCRQALEDLKKKSGHCHPDVATMLKKKKLVYRDQNKKKEATDLLHDALQIRKKKLGPEHPAVSGAPEKKSGAAEPLCQREKKIREKVLKKNHPDVAKQLNNLALLCQNQGKFEDVERHYKKKLSIYEALGGPHDPKKNKTKNNLVRPLGLKKKRVEGLPWGGTHWLKKKRAPWGGEKRWVLLGVEEKKIDGWLSGWTQHLPLTSPPTIPCACLQFPSWHLDKAPRTLSASTQDLSPR